RREGGDDSPRLHRHAPDARQPLFDAVPDGGRGLRRARVPHRGGGRELPRDPLADGGRGQDPAPVAQPAVRPSAGGAAAQAPANRRPITKGATKAPFHWQGELSVAAAIATATAAAAAAARTGAVRAAEAAVVAATAAATAAGPPAHAAF